MKKLYKPEDSVRIAIENLQLGMFVTAIERSTKVSLEVAGVVSNEKSIAQLVESGVKFVYVDVKLSAKECKFIIAEDPKAKDTEEKPLEASKKPKTQKVAPSVSNRKAKTLVTEARTLANKLIQDTFEGKSVNIDAVERWADDIIDTVLESDGAIMFVSALRSKDAYLLEHSVNVACLLITFGKFLKLGKQELKHLAIGGMIHDLGKTKVKDNVLNKPGKLTDDEFEHMKLHQVFVSELMEDIPSLSKTSMDVCLLHHEKLDGTGYPKGLADSEISLYGRMSAIVDIYDALTAERCYKHGMSPSDAFKILLSMTPAKLDQELVYKFINCLGIYPVGSLVELTDGSVGIVEAKEQKAPAKPKVKCFYSNKHKKFTEVKSLKLIKTELCVEKALAPKALGIDLSPFYD
ncbi:HD-GYP domain-containing protein [Vibrio hannami]|uniref:HD-GYP domain-containing protein n=1 Tax=Vibrio hannami TaxID=2717094 RepID=UPI00240F3422|nr:HD-GYP domain-containing protein [Vibrio hannami]MDG3088454.1 HD-GYP domain-containing protein [Vibrio hannami]